MVSETADPIDRIFRRILLNSLVAPENGYSRLTLLFPSLSPSKSCYRRVVARYRRDCAARKPRFTIDYYRSLLDVRPATVRHESRLMPRRIQFLKSARERVRPIEITTTTIVVSQNQHTYILWYPRILIFGRQQLLRFGSFSSILDVSEGIRE